MCRIFELFASPDSFGLELADGRVLHTFGFFHMVWPNKISDHPGPHGCSLSSSCTLSMWLGLSNDSQCLRVYPAEGQRYVPLQFRTVFLPSGLLCPFKLPTFLQWCMTFSWPFPPQTHAQLLSVTQLSTLLGHWRANVMEVPVKFY